ncbi:ferric reductase like transmembrane component-domain-containing protein [Mycena epipterygia]|nr:ferric reductase like transmembrane component-domain-containing protein [Mycena epipterygia]
MGASDDSHTTYEPKTTVRMRAETPGAYPPHLEPAPSFLRPVVSLLRSRVAPGLSAAQIAICAGYLSVILYASIYRSSGPFMDYNRFGFIAISQVPFIFAFGSKNNVLGMFLGMGYEKLNFLHRFVARLAILASHIHGIGYVYKWCLAENFMEEISESKNYFGLIMLLAFDGLLLLSTAYVRRNAYNVFFYSHILFFHAAVICGFYHYPQLFPYLYASIAIYGLDKLLRIAKTRISTATIRAIPELGITRVEMPYINKGWRAGQHVRIQVFSTAMGVTGWAQPHPFTIASASGSNEGLVLMCKKTGDWTHKLFATAAMSQSEWGVGRDIKIMVEGPYGGPGFALFNSYSAAVFVVGGSGITFALSAVQELIQQDLRGESRVRVIELIWVVQDAGSLVPLIPQFTAMMQQSAYACLTISVHYTKAVVDKNRINNGMHPGLSLSPGRPRFINAIESIVSRAVSSGSGEQCGLLVGVCGPAALGDDVSKAVGLVDPTKRDAIGGIEIHEEVFGW